MTLDRSLTFHNYLKKTSEIVRTYNNLLSKLAGSTWRVNTKTLQTSALALCYFTAEYWAPIWCRSSHMKLVDVQLNSTMHIIPGTLQPITLLWLPATVAASPMQHRFISHFTLRGDSQTGGEDTCQKVFRYTRTCMNASWIRLSSHCPLWSNLDRKETSVARMLQAKWSAAEVRNNCLIANTIDRVPGSEQLLRLWSLFNRF